jgi:hypothetical protein
MSKKIVKGDLNRLHIDQSLLAYRSSSSSCMFSTRSSNDNDIIDGNIQLDAKFAQFIPNNTDIESNTVASPFEEYMPMLNELSEFWCDGAPGSCKKEYVKLCLDQSYTALKDSGFIENAEKLEKCQIDAVSRLTEDILESNRRQKRKWNWYQPNIMFICEDNAGLSQMAQRITMYASHEQIMAHSAGLKVSSHIHAAVIEGMNEPGYEITNVGGSGLDLYPKLLLKTISASMHKIIFIGKATNVPDDVNYVMTKDSKMELVVWDNMQSINDLTTVAEVRKIKSRISTKVNELVESMGFKTRTR